MLAIEKTVCYSQFSREGGKSHYGGPHREALGLIRRQREGGPKGKSLYCGFHEKEHVTQGKQFKTG